MPPSITATGTGLTVYATNVNEPVRLNIAWSDPGLNDQHEVQLSRQAANFDVHQVPLIISSEKRLLLTSAISQGVRYLDVELPIFNDTGK